MNIFILMSLVLTLLPPIIGTGQRQKYGLKSGVITYDQTVTLGKTTHTSRIVVTFDDYGLKECGETFTGSVLDETFISDGKKFYSIKHKQKIVYVMGSALRGAELTFDWSEVSVKEKKDGRARLLPSLSVAGKICDAYQIVSGSTKSTFAGWAAILLFSEVTSAQSTTILKATAIEEGVSVLASKFQLPAGYKLQNFGK